MSDGAERWRRLEEICQAALERPSHERSAYLAEACGGDEELRREAASLIDREAHAEGFLAMPIGEMAAHAMTYSPGGTPQPDPSRDMVGRRIGSYEIRALLGAGGMGEVYRAHDHTLGRDVAVKLLPAAFSADRERLARFEREARLLASLSHPHIGAIHGLEGSGEVRALVLELIDGETLQARLGRGPFPTAQALTLAVQMAEALDHAHRRGVTHRDLKPGNIMLTKAGVKLLDFGLAKWSRGQSGSVNLSQRADPVRPAGVESLTEAGMILGTPHYMAPEQLEGRPVDARVDVFAFGAVLYEMLSGRKAFVGGSAAAVMAAVLNTEPPALDTIQSLAPRSLERVIRKCLAKDPDQRWQTARDLADELKWIADEAERPSSSVLDRGGRRAGLNRWVMLSGAALALVLAGWVGWRMGTANEPSAARTIVTFPAMPSVAGNVDAFDISADGTTLVYAINRRLYLRHLDQLTDVSIPGSEGADEVAFSPDGQWVAFFSENRLLKVNVKTMASPILLWEGQSRSLNRSTVWLDDGTIITARDQGNGLMRVPAEGGEPQAMTSFTETPPELDHHSPLLLPGGRALIFTVHSTTGFKVVAQVLSSGDRKVLIESAFDPQYVSTGHLVFARAQTILAVPFDVRRLEVTGPEVTLVENVAVTALDGNGGYRVSKSGTLVFRPARSLDGRRLVWVDRTGAETAVPLGAQAFSSPSVSPDGRLLAYAVAEGGRRDLWTYEVATEKVTRVTRESDNRTPIWTPDGRRLTYSSTRGGSRGLFWQTLGAGFAPEHLVSGDALLVPGAWSADGKVLVYADGGAASGSARLYSVAVDGNRKPTPLLHGQRAPSVSPDGRWIAYTSPAPQRTEVFVSDYPELTAQHQVSTEGGRQAKWSRDGREIVYRSVGKMFAVSVDLTRGFSAGKPRVLFEGDHVIGDRDVNGLDYDLAPDGRFLMMKRGPQEQTPVGLRVVLNWVDELARRVPKTQ